MNKLLISVIFISISSYAWAKIDPGVPMTASDIQANIIGRRVYLSAPLGGELPLHYSRDGSVDGTGEAIGLGKFLKPTDTGKWWIDNNRLCQQFQTWYDGKAMCFILNKISPGKVFWRRDNGETGIARISN